MRENTPCPELLSLEAKIARGNLELKMELERIRHDLDFVRSRTRPPAEAFKPPDPVTVVMFAALAVLIMLIGWA